MVVNEHGVKVEPSQAVIDKRVWELIGPNLRSICYGTDANVRI